MHCGGGGVALLRSCVGLGVIDTAGSWERGWCSGGCTVFKGLQVAARRDSIKQYYTHDEYYIECRLY